MFRTVPGRRTAARATTVLIVAALAATGCSGQGTSGKKHRSTSSRETERERTGDARTPAAGRPEAAPRPRTAAQFVERARRAMRAEHGWTFALRGTQSLVMAGGAPDSATFAATAHRTTGPDAFRSTGTVTGKSGPRSERVFLVDGTVHEKTEGKSWKQGPLSDPEMADQVEDPVAELDVLARYAKSAKVTGAGTRTGEVRLRVRASGWRLAAAKKRPALTSPVRELQPLLDQLRKVGVTATDSQVTLKDFEETWVLDAGHGYRLASHQYAFTFVIPYRGKDITLTQELRQENRGVFEGRVTLPAEAAGAAGAAGTA
ncbi:hypothetical protein [Streptomyces sp. KL116D]|uniref:hypothetical protein n=1 Tax=Streptomyces sp. KL116D TaxID=3045152 RepID=UPI0035580451